MTGSDGAPPSGGERAADALCRVLTGLGADCVFGLPGTQNMELTEALRRSDLRWVVPSHELAAAFMANGYYRASGRPGVVTTIPGPGFTWALTGLAEARLDSAAVLCVTGVHAGDGGTGNRLQEIPQARIADPIVKRVLRVASADELPRCVELAYRATTEGEPGPVLLEIEKPVWSQVPGPGDAGVGAGGAGDDGGSAEGRPPSGGVRGDASAVGEVARRLAAARRPLLLAGQGAQEAADGVRRLAESLGSPVLLTTSGRGVLPESHPLAVAMDALERPVDAVNRLLDAADLVLVLGCKLGHNATLGFRIRLPADDLVRVDASAEVLQDDSHPASLGVVSDVPDLVRRLLRDREDGAGRGASPGWSEGRPKPGSASGPVGPDDAGQPRVRGFGEMDEFFGALRRAMPRDGCLVTDSGLHQMLARRHFRVEAPRSLVTPTNFQSMGYGIPAAVGAALARPDRPVVAVVGDGGLRLGAFELSTARELDVNLTVLVFVDGRFGLIHRQQLEAFGRGSGVDLPELDLSGLSASLGVPHSRVGSDAEEELARRVGHGGVHVVEVPLEDPDGLRLDALRARMTEDARRVLGPGRMRRVRRWRARWRRGDD